jgi:hypothetical protein
MHGDDLATDAERAARAGVDGMSVEATELQRLGVREAARIMADAGLGPR